MERMTQVTKLDERSKYTTMWPVGRVELGGRVYHQMEEPEERE